MTSGNKVAEEKHNNVLVDVYREKVNYTKESMDKVEEARIKSLENRAIAAEAKVKELQDEILKRQTGKPSVMVLLEAIDLQIKKSNDYQNPNSTIVQKDYYPRGIASIYDVMNTKMLRLKSVMEAMQHEDGYDANFESLEDSAKDLINYASFFVAYCRYGIEGQEKGQDIFR